MTTAQLFPAHRDASTPCTELLEWLTDVQIAIDGTDDARRQLRAFPRHTYSYDVVLPPSADKSPLDTLRTAESFVVPLWCHAFQRPDLEATAGIATTDPKTVALTATSEGVLYDADAFTWPDDYYIAAPAALARPVADSRSIAYITKTAQKSSVSFLLLNFKEVVADYDGPTVDGLPSLDTFTPYWNEPAEDVTEVADKFDEGHLTLHDLHYFQRTFSLSLTLPSREVIEDFRRFLFALKGRLNPMAWTAPGDEDPTTWRLASDGVALTYLRPNFATCKLSLIQIT